jgi:hypothetical protein
MMPNLDRIYDGEFFREWGSGNAAYVEGARRITDLLWEIYKPLRLIDLGCGCGVYADAFRRKGAHVTAVDGVLPAAEDSFPGPVERRDLTVPFPNPWGTFDMALCLEVAEHIPEDLSGPFLANITQFSDRLILSAAQPGQGGHHHVNEKPKRYWVEKLAGLGFAYNRPATGRMLEAFKGSHLLSLGWMGSNISVYERMGPDFPHKRHQPFRPQKRPPGAF